MHSQTLVQSDTLTKLRLIRIQDIRSANQIFAEHTSFSEQLIQSFNTIDILSARTSELTIQVNSLNSTVVKQEAINKTLNEIVADERKNHATELRSAKRGTRTAYVIAAITTLTTILLLTK